MQNEAGNDLVEVEFLPGYVLGIYFIKFSLWYMIFIKILNENNLQEILREGCIMALVPILKEKANQVAEKVTKLLLEEVENNPYVGMERNELLIGITEKVNALIRCLETGKDCEFEEYIRKVGFDKVFQGCSFKDVITIMVMIRTAFLEEIEEATNDLLKVLKRTKIIVKVVDNANMVLADAFLHTREEIIEQQKMVALEFATPVLPVTEEILITPIIGKIDTNRVQYIMENILQEIIDKKAQVAIIDVTGVPVIDAEVADNLIKTAQVAKLLGCTCVLVGINPKVAQTLVSLEIDFNNIITKQSLQQGLEYALQILNLKITTISPTCPNQHRPS